MTVWYSSFDNDMMSDRAHEKALDDDVYVPYEVRLASDEVEE